MQLKLLTLNELMDRVRTQMPINLTVPDPFSGQPIQVHREDVMRIMVIDGGNLLADGQVLAAHFVEFARAQRACEYSAEYAERGYKKWRAQRSNELRHSAKTKETKAPTVAETEDAYRVHADYERVSSEPARWLMLAGIFEDLKNAMQIKSRVLTAQLHNLNDYERTVRAEDKVERSRT